MHAFEERQRKEGKPVNHEFAKELIASFAGAEVDKLCETKGLDYVDREKAKHQAKKNATELYDQQVCAIWDSANRAQANSHDSTASTTSTTPTSRVPLTTSSSSSVVTTTTEQLNLAS
jgi:hypothetical protein